MKEKHLVIGDFRFPWYDLGTTSSTMEEAQEKIREGCSTWTVITAMHQSCLLYTSPSPRD